MGKASSIVAISVPLGNLLGMAITGYLFSDFDHLKNQLKELIFACNLVMTVIFLLFITTFREKPASPPSAAATKEIEKKDIVRSFHELKDNRNFVFISVYYAFLLGTYATFGNLQSQLFRPYGLRIGQMTVMICACILTGVASSLLFGKLLDKTRAYKTFMVLIPCLLIADMLLMGFYALPHAKESATPLFITMITFGMALLPVIPLCLSFSVEVTFPLNASTSNSMVVFAGHCGSFIMTIVGTELTRQDFSKDIP